MVKLEVPLVGGVCERVPMSITNNGFCEHVIGWHEIRDNYEVRGFEYGNQRFNILFDKIQAEKTKTDCIYPNWNDLLVIKAMLNLPELRKEELNMEQNFVNIFGADYNPVHKANILKYAKQIVCKWQLPLFISGSVFGKDGQAYMLDGSTRISALVLRGVRQIGCLLAIQRHELPQYINIESLNTINEMRSKITWFPDYQSIPELGITSGRTRQRYGLYDFTTIKGSTVADFGCNIGQSCLEYYYSGAVRVYGFDCQEDVINTAKEISEVLGVDGEVFYEKVDFNSPDFDKQIDALFPDQFDYSSYYSVYRTKELTQRDRVFQYIIKKTKHKIFFEGHADPIIDSPKYYEELFDRNGLAFTFLGYGEPNIRPFYVLEKL